MKRMQTYSKPKPANPLLSKMLGQTAISSAVLKKQGHQCLQNGNFQGAVASYEAVLESDPSNVDILSNMGNAYQSLGQYDNAQAAYHRALAIDPNHAISLTNLGGLLVQQKKYADAAALFIKVVAMSPKLPEVHYNLGSALYELGDLEAALRCFNHALQLNEKFDLAYIYKGNALIGLHRYDEAVTAYDTALQLNPKRGETYFSRGNAYKKMREYRAAMADFMHAIEYRPDFAKAYWNLGLMLLVLGELEQGWKLHEWRWKLPELGLKQHHFSQPLWLGEENIIGKHLFICDEQGAGDKIQMMRYAPILANLGVQVSIEVPRPLLQLAESLGPHVTVIAEGERPSSFDVYCPYMSLPLAMGTRLDNIPAEVPYLRASEKSVQNWNEKVKPLPIGKSLRVGLAWSGAAIHTNDKNRSMSLEVLYPLLENEHIEFFSLQKEYRSADQTLMQALQGKIQDYSDLLNNFSDTAALIEKMDVVVSVDTSIAHLAGAMGKPVMLMLPHTPDFRWLIDRHDSPWYPTMHLFRQNSPANWADVIKEIDGVLKSLCGESSSTMRT